MQQKTDLRRVMRIRISEQSAQERATKSAQICARLIEWHKDQAVPLKRVAIFLAGPREPNLDAFGQYLQSVGTNVYAPCMTQCQAPFARLAVNWSNVGFNAANWREPQPGSESELLSAGQMDAIFLPGLAFDLKGNRLGQGGGWYDRALEGLSYQVPCIGIGFDFQIVSTIPHEPHDHKISILVTEKRTAYVRTDGTI
jgi:5-formyltetrahydrofolate cyclo-ligase